MNQNTTNTTKIRIRKTTKSELAKRYGTTWRSFRNQVYLIIPSLKGNRRRILLPSEIRTIYNELGLPTIEIED